MTDAEPSPTPIPFAEFVALCAAMMALGALGVDAMLPALPAIGARLEVPDPRDWTLVLGVYMFGFGVAQVIHGPLADRYGRRPVLIVSLAIFALSNVAAAVSGSFELLLAARFTGGVAVASTRVVVIALIRDLYSGRAMARVSSFVFMTFMAVPILAPALGQLVLLVGSWRLIFASIATFATLTVSWYAWRLPETLLDSKRLPLAPARIAANWGITLRDRMSLGYMLAATALQGALLGYLNSIQPIMDRVFGRPELLAVVFAGSAVLMAVANLMNARIVMRVGTRRISQTATVVLILASVANLAIAHAGYETLWTFSVLQAVTMACYGLASANFSAMAMSNMGALAGTASSVQGFVTMVGGTAVGVMVGRAFDGTTTPLHAAFLAGGIGALAIVAVVERGRLFQPTAQ